jgi:hypothetical protein
MSYLEQLISTVAILHWYEATLPYHNWSQDFHEKLNHAEGPMSINAEGKIENQEEHVP